MCGLAGVVAPAGVDPGMLATMRDALAHRGPDGCGFLAWREGRPLEALAEPARGGDVASATVGFAHLRLSIIDLTPASAQPMVDDGLALVYNGELYNYLELRGELAGRGHSFRTDGDTEVVLAAYREWGRDCVQRFVGMWAFALLDARSRRLLLSRDRFGIKPLFYAATEGRLAFASEIKALLRSGAARPEPNERAVRRYLLTGRVDETAETFFEGVLRLPPACDALVELADPRVEPRRWWGPPEPAPPGACAPRDEEEHFAALLADSVALHARSDTPVGTCLSGGLDSSAIVCVAEQLRERAAIPSYAHHGFGYVPDDPALSERRHMDVVAAQTGLEMTYVTPSDTEVAAALTGIVRQQDEPFGTASIAAQWFVFRAAHEAGLKVMLDGQGADEVLAGYLGFLGVRAQELLRERRLPAYARLAIDQRRRIGGWPMSPAAALGLALAGPAPVDGPAAGSQPPPMADLLAPGLRARCEPADWTVEPPDTLEQTLRRHTTAIGLPALLRFEDRNSMAHSIEARVPFLDHRLVEYAFRLPPESKLRGAETKSILRRALKGVLPEPIRTRRDKIGFRAEPEVTWTLAERHRAALVAPASELEAGWLDGAALGRLIDHRGGADAEFALWRAMNLKLWLRSVVEGRDDPLA